MENTEVHDLLLEIDADLSALIQGFGHKPYSGVEEWVEQMKVKREALRLAIGIVGERG